MRTERRMIAGTGVQNTGVLLSPPALAFLIDNQHIGRTKTKPFLFLSMAAPVYRTYQKFTDRSEAIALIELFNAAGIYCELEDDAPAFDPAFAGRNPSATYSVKIPPGDFARAEQVQAAVSEDSVAHADAGHYLFRFSDEELRELIRRKDEWSHFDYTLALKILADRGIAIDETALSGMRATRIQELARPEPRKWGWIVTGYATAFLGGGFALLIGWHLSSFKRTLPDGSSVYNFSEPDRRQGRIIFSLGLVFMAFFIVLKIVSNT
ncbi:MAG: hypothetical protein INR69_12200 [Mucilaginibacter polytrichastri]|nr:hypothetical protein [Mucilaginibacter polytrichastri]